jgi:hypothetical protein
MNSITFNLFFLFSDNIFMGKEQISIRLEPEILQKIDELAGNENRTRNNMLEVLILEALKTRTPSNRKSNHE